MDAFSRDARGAAAPVAPDFPSNPRLGRLIAKARAALLFERVWRIAVPPLLVVGLFLCVSFTGIWLETPHRARALGVLLFAIGLIAALLPLRKLRFPSRGEALARIDQVSGFAHSPATVLEDRLGNGVEDPATRALWSLHRRRAEEKLAALRSGLPSPRMADRDRYALRAAVLVAIVATGFVAGPEKYARLAAAFDWRFSGLTRGDYRLDAWIDPPAYTGKPPIILSNRPADAAQNIEAPTGSLVMIRASGADVSVEAKGALSAQPEQARAGGPSPSGAKETRLLLQGDAVLALGVFGRRLGPFALTAIPDRPPTIALTDAPQANARGSLTLAYQVSDDYGVVNAEAQFAKPSLDERGPSKRSLVDPPRVALVLPPSTQRDGEAETMADLSEHPWAGASVEMTLVARDEGGNEGKSQPIQILLPQKPFTNPLARALVEQRRNLVLAPDDKARVATALEGLMIAPDAFDTQASVYLGLRVALDRLNAASKDSELLEVADYLWEMALRIENGDLSEAERDLRAAEEQLREALQRHAPEDEIRKLSENLRAAMDKFLRQFAEKQPDQADRDAAPDARRQLIDPKDLQAMLDKMQEMARSGDVADAQKMLERLQNILENLQMARPHKSDPRTREVNRALDELGEMTKDQQDLRDDTYQSGESRRHEQNRRRAQMGFPGQPNFGNSFDDEEEDAENGHKNAPEGQKNEAELGKRQQALADRLQKLQERLKQAGQGETGLDDAQDAMNDAAKDLGQGGRGGDEAVEAQGRALDAMREGAQKLAESMRPQGEGESSGEAGDGQDGQGQGSRGLFGEDDADPLGRPTGGERAFNPRARFDPMGVPAAQRAQRVLEELRRRLGDPARPQEELDYLERLLRPY